MLWRLAALAAVLTAAARADNLQDFEDCMAGDEAASASTQEETATVELDADSNFFVNSSSLYADYATGPKARIDRKPAGVFFATSEDEIVRAVVCAVASDLAPVPRSGGHSYEVLSSMDGSLVIDMAEMTEVKVVEEDEDEGSAIATVEAGARLGRVYLELDDQGGYSFNAGTCPTVGVGGHISGGGYGVSSRKYGLAADLTTELRVVLYNGTVVTANEDENADLFWAIRGGGAGSFGIVTLFTIKVYKITEVSVFNLQFGPDYNADVLRAWMDYFPTADERITTQLNVQGTGATLTGQFLGSKSDLNAIFNESGLLDLGDDALTSDTRLDDCTPIGAKAFVWKGNCNATDEFDVAVHLTTADKDYSRIRGGYAVTVMSDEGIDAVVEYANSVPSTTWAYIQFEAYGGVFADQENDMTPWNHRDAVFSMQIGVGTVKDELETSTSYQWIDNFIDALATHLDGGNYQNYCDLDLGDDFGDKYWGADNYARLQQIKAAYDPTDVFRSAQSIPLPSSAATGSGSDDAAGSDSVSNTADSSSSASSGSPVGMIASAAAVTVTLLNAIRY
jgi:FAD/FMN-containing dehydrogenase